jgi:hypothetical protein
LIIGPLICGGTGASHPVGAPLLAGFARSGMFRKDSGFFRRMAQLDSTLHGHLWPILAIVVTLAIAANSGRVGSQKLIDAHFDPRRMPIAAVNYVEQRDIKGPILSPDFWGGYLIYRLYPKQRVVLDDRHDLYGEEFFRSYLKFIHGEPEWENFASNREIGSILLPKNAPTATILLQNGRWKSVYSDDVSTLFLPAAPQ